MTTEQKPSIGRIVHYLAYGTPGGEYKSEPRAAIITAVHQDTIPNTSPVDICVMNPTGLFFNQKVTQGDKPGQWQWPPRV